MKLNEFLSFCEVSDGQFVAGDVFSKKFGGLPPEDGHHLVVFYRQSPNQLIPACYVHFRPFGDICLVGGACTDGDAFSYMSDKEKLYIKEQGGLYLHLLDFAFERFSSRFTAFFGHCGDARALEVDLQAGFRLTEHQYLIIYTQNQLDATVEKALIAKAAALGPF